MAQQKTSLNIKSAKIQSILGDHVDLRLVMHRAEWLLTLQQQFAELIPQPYVKVCQVLGLDDGLLTVGVSNTTLAAKFKQMAPDLVELLQSKGWEVNAIRVKVQVALDYPREKTSRQLGNTARQALNDLQQTLPDSPLKHALEKLVKRS